MTEPTMTDAYEIDLVVLSDATEALAPGDGPPLRSIEAIAERYEMSIDEAVTWALRRLGDAQEKIDRVDRLAAAEIARAKTFKTRAVVDPERDRAFFDAILTDYAERVLVPTGTKTVQFPTGKLTAHKAKDRAVVTDVEAFVLWARQTKNLGPFVKVEMSPKVAELTKALRPPTDLEEVYDSDDRVRPEFAVLDASASPPLIGTRDGVLIAGAEREELAVLRRDAAILDVGPPVECEVCHAADPDCETCGGIGTVAPPPLVVNGVRWEAGLAVPKAAAAPSAGEEVTPAP